MPVSFTQKKTISKPPRTLIYGEPGIGKSTFASMAPDAAFVCCEQGVNNIAVSRAQIDERDPQSFADVIAILDAPATYKTLVIDTVDALESMIHAHVCQLGNKTSLSQFDYGKGYDMSVDAMRMVLARLESINSRGVGIVLAAHSHVMPYRNPEGQDFDYYDVKVHKKISGLLIEWCDNVLFARREQHALKEGEKVRGVSTGNRVMHTQKSPAFVAKNRYDLPEKLPLSWAAYQAAYEMTPESLKKAALAIVETLEAEDKPKALEALKGMNTVRALTEFIEYAKGKVKKS